jgi:hypothetical protein
VLRALSQKANTNEKNDSSSINTIHFVEDRYETLLAVHDVPHLNHVQLYLAGDTN